MGERQGADDAPGGSLWRGIAVETSYRLLFAYEGEKLVLRSVKEVAMRALASESTSDQPARTGRFVELRSAQGSPVYRRHVSGAVPRTIEYPTGDPARPFGHARPPRGAVFSVVVPAHAEARTAALVDVEGRAGAGAKQAAVAPAQRDVLVVDLPTRKPEAGR